MSFYENNIQNVLIDTVMPDGGYIMTVYNVYIDESYSDPKRPPIFAVGGYLIHSDKAKQMDLEWRRMLKKYQIGYFHMAEIAHNKSEYRHLKKDAREELSKEVISIVKKHVAQGFVAIANPKLMQPEFKSPYASGEFYSDPYTYCLGECIVALSSWMEEQSPNGKIIFFAESGHNNGEKTRKVIDDDLRAGEIPGTQEIRKYYGGLFFGQKCDLCLLQAADLLVWHARKFIDDMVTNQRPARADFKSLVSKNHRFTYTIGNNPDAMPNIDVFGVRLNQDAYDGAPHIKHWKRELFIRALFSQNPSQG